MGIWHKSGRKRVVASQWDVLISVKDDEVRTQACYASALWDVKAERPRRIVEWLRKGRVVRCPNDRRICDEVRRMWREQRD